MTRILNFASLDLTPRTTDAEIKNQYEEILASPEIVKILDSVPEALLILNRSRQIIYANPYMLDILHISGAGEVLGMRLGEALKCDRAVTSKDGCGTTPHCEYCGALSAILAGQTGQSTEEEWRITKTDTKTALDLKVSISPFTENELSYTILGVKDISDKKRKEMLERIFFHDLLNTAGGLQGYSELLMMADPEEESEIKQIIVRLSEQIVLEIQAQRQLVQAENEELAIVPTRINTIDLIGEVFDTYREHEIIGERSLEMLPSVTSIDFVTDPVLLTRVLGNLVKNALEASDDGRVVSAGVREKEDWVEFSIHNHCVMTDSVRQQIFQRSFSTKGVGRGLGTYSIKLITEKYLMGKVRFSSQEPAGTTFYIELPKKFPVQ